MSLYVSNYGFAAIERCGCVTGAMAICDDNGKSQAEFVADVVKSGREPRRMRAETISRKLNLSSPHKCKGES